MYHSGARGKRGKGREAAQVQKVQRVHGHACGVRVHKVQKVQRVQRVVVAPFGRIIKEAPEAPYLANAVVLYNFLGQRLISSCVRDDSLLMSSRRPVFFSGLVD